MGSYEKQDYLTTEPYLYGPDDCSASLIPPATPRRGSDESSTAGSDYGIETENVITGSGNAKVLNAYHTKSHLNLRIQDTAGRTLYHVENRQIPLGKPDVTLRAGSEKDGPVLGVCRWSHMYSRHFNVGLGDPFTDEKNTTWEEVKTDHIRHPEFKWSVGNVSGGGRTLAWHRIHGDDAAADGDEKTNTMSMKNFKLIDCGSGEVLAVFASNRYKSWSKLGKFTIKVDGVARGWGEKWELMVLLTALGLVEMSRRRGRQRRSNPHGGP